MIKSTPHWLLHNERPLAARVTTIVLHHDAGASDKAGLQYLINVWRRYKGKNSIAASYHYYVGRDGTVTKCVPISKRAWHMGVSVGPSGPDVNDYSIGVCLANRGDGEDYPDVQVDAARRLCRTLAIGVPSLKWISTHRLTCEPNGRKVDPAMFDFLAFHKSLYIPLEKWRIGERPWNG